MTNVIEIKPKSDTSRWVALNFNDNSIILVEGKNPEIVAKKAEAMNVTFIMQFVPDPKSSYIL